MFRPTPVTQNSHWLKNSKCHVVLGKIYSLKKIKIKTGSYKGIFLSTLAWSETGAVSEDPLPPHTKTHQIKIILDSEIKVTNFITHEGIS